MKYTYTAVFTEKDGKVYARVPDLNGFITTGKYLSDAIEQMADAMAAWLCAAEDADLPIPKPTQQSKIFCGNCEELSLVNADTLKYRAETDTKSVRKMFPCLCGCQTSRTNGISTVRRFYRTRSWREYN